MDFQKEIEFSLIGEMDAPAFWRLIQYNHVHIEIYFPVTLDLLTSLPSTEDFVRKKNEEYLNKKGAYFLIKTGNKIIGVFSMKNIEWRVPKCEIAYFIDKDYQGRGIISYAISWIANHCFNESKMKKIYALVGENNMESQTVLVKNGFKQELLLINDYRDGNGNLINSIYFAKHKDSIL